VRTLALALAALTAALTPAAAWPPGHPGPNPYCPCYQYCPWTRQQPTNTQTTTTTPPTQWWYNYNTGQGTTQNQSQTNQTPTTQQTTATPSAPTTNAAPATTTNPTNPNDLANLTNLTKETAAMEALYYLAGPDASILGLAIVPLLLRRWR